MVTGATGTVGREVVRALHDRADVVACCRHVESAELPRGVGRKRFDLGDTVSFARTCQGAEAVFWLTPLVPDPVDATVSALSAARSSGVEHVVLLSARSVEWDERPSLRRWQRAIEDELSRSPGSYTVVRPCSFMQNLVSDVSSLRVRRSITLPMGDGAIPFVDARDLGEAAAACLLERERHAGRSYTWTGARALTGAEVASAMSRVLGMEISYVDRSSDEARGDAIARGVPDFVVDAGIEVYDRTRMGGEAGVSTDLADVLGRAPTDLDAFLERVLAAD